MRRVLFLVEGEKTEPRILAHLFSVYGLSDAYEIVPVGGVVHQLLLELENCYGDSLSDPDEYDVDTIELLRQMFPQHEDSLAGLFTDLILTFDYDPHDDRFDPERLRLFQGIFSDSTDSGMLYISYPAIESFHDFASIGDQAFGDDCLVLKRLKEEGFSGYKDWASRRGADACDITRLNALDWSRIIAMHVGKVRHLAKGEPYDAFRTFDGRLAKAAQEVDLEALLAFANDRYRNEGVVYPCCTLLFFMGHWPRALDGAWRKAVRFMAVAPS